MSFQPRTRQCPSARGGCWIFCRKKMSERSELFFQKNPTATPQARPHNRKAGSPSPAAPPNGKSGRPSRTPRKPNLNQLHSHGSRFTTANAEGRHTAFQRSEEHTSELQSRPHLVCRLL